MRFVPGKEYRFDQLDGHVWGQVERAKALGPDARFRYELHPGASHGYFELVDEGPDPLIPGEGSRLHVQSLLERGLSLRQIARSAGLAFETVQRANSGVGRVRQSTEAALAQVAASANGQR